MRLLAAVAALSVAAIALSIAVLLRLLDRALAAFRI